MLTIQNLAPVLDLASTHGGLRDDRHVSSVLAETGWDPSPPDHDGAIDDCRWRFAGPSSDPVLGTHTWTSSSGGTGLGLGIIIETASLPAARALRDTIRAHIVSIGSFVQVESGEGWCAWSDGRVRVDLGVLAGSENDGESIRSTVQVGLEPEGLDPEGGAGIPIAGVDHPARL